MDKVNLLHAYVRRQQFLAQLQALEVAKVLFGKAEPREISTAEMMRIIGAE